jgi:hypothetical protein
MTKPKQAPAAPREPVLDQITGTTHHRSIASWTKWLRGDEAELIYAISPSLGGEIELLGPEAEELKELRRVVCPMCGDLHAVLGSSRGPHAASIRCAECDRHRGWVSATTASFIGAVIDEVGRPTDPIIVHRSTTVTS